MNRPQCARCRSKLCKQGISEGEGLPDYCPMVHYKSLIPEVSARYADPGRQAFFVQSALTEKQSYDEQAARVENRRVPIRPRIAEIAAFAGSINVQKLGMAFCIGLADEASRACSILEGHGLEVCSVVCCCGAIDKTDLGIPKEIKIRDPERFEASCNPLLQAEILNRSGTGFNLIVGLCVGHDMLFTQASQAPVTTLIVKDRFTGHNPVITLYSRYHRDLV